MAKWAESAHDLLQDLDATARTEVVSKEQPEQIIIDDEPEPQVEKVREKIVISIQDKNARQQFRVFKVIIIFLHKLVLLKKTRPGGENRPAGCRWLAVTTRASNLRHNLVLLLFTIHPI